MGTCAFWDQCWSLACVPKKKTAQVECNEKWRLQVYILIVFCIFLCLSLYTAHCFVGVNKLPWNNTSDSVSTASRKQTHTCRLRSYGGLSLYMYSLKWAVNKTYTWLHCRRVISHGKTLSESCSYCAVIFLFGTAYVSRLLGGGKCPMPEHQKTASLMLHAIVANELSLHYNDVNFWRVGRGPNQGACSVFNWMF